MDSYLKNVVEFNKQLGREGLSSYNLKDLKNKKVDGLFVLGMGGSGLAGEVLVATRKEIGLKAPLVLYKDYGLPDKDIYGFKNPFYVFVSFSGNTEETVSGLQAALKSPAIKKSSAVIATGGELLQLAEKHGLPTVSFPASDLTPRQATGRMFYGLMEILRELKLVSSRDFSMTHLSTLSFKSAGKSLAKKLSGSLPIFYTDEAHRHLGYFWKIRINETAKTQAFLNVLPEMNHNEIVSFEKPIARTSAIFINSAEKNRLNTRIDITKNLLKKSGAKIISLNPKGKSSLEETWNMIMLADWTSYFMAEINKVKPAPVKIVEELKDRMRRK